MFFPERAAFPVVTDEFIGNPPGTGFDPFVVFVCPYFREVMDAAATVEGGDYLDLVFGRV